MLATERNKYEDLLWVYSKEGIALSSWYFPSVNVTNDSCRG
jgi:hypothetical protein